MHLQSTNSPVGLGFDSQCLKTSFVFAYWFPLIGHSFHQEGTEVHVVDQLTQRVVLCSSLQSDRPDHIHAHLTHSSKEVFDSQSYPTAQCVRRFLFFSKRIPSAAFEHDEFLAVAFFYHIPFTTPGSIGAVSKHGIVHFIHEVLEYLAVVHIGARHHAANDQLTLGIHLRVVLVADAGIFVLLSPLASQSFCLPLAVSLPNSIGRSPFLILLFWSRLLCWPGASTKLASTILPSCPTSPCASIISSNRAKRRSLPLRPSRSHASRKSYNVLASGMASPRRSPRKCMKLKRSAICSSTEASLWPSNFCSMRTLNINNGSKGGRPLLLSSRVT